MADKTGSVDFIAGFVIGALAGAAAALLMAPQSGEQTRVMIRDKGIELRDQADSLTAEARRRAQELQLQAKERTVGLQSQMKQAVEEGKTVAAKRKEELLSRLQEGRGVTGDMPAETPGDVPPEE